jgi:hypothetical protein
MVSGKGCFFRTDCGSIGLGLFLGAGITMPFGIAMSDIEESLPGTSIGLGVDWGICWAASGFGATVGFNEDGITSIGSSKGSARFGAGCGFSLTIDFCETKIQGCEELPIK